MENCHTYVYAVSSVLSISVRSLIKPRVSFSPRSTLPNLDAPYPMLVLTGPLACWKRELSHRLCRKFNNYFRYRYILGGGEIAESNLLLLCSACSSFCPPPLVAYHDTNHCSSFRFWLKKIKAASSSIYIGNTVEEGVMV